MNPTEIITKVCRDTDRYLWAAYKRNEMNKYPDLGGLVFPKYRCGSSENEKKNGKKRFSEQGARFAFVESLRWNGLFYSPEAPTEQTYGFSGKGERSACTDLAVCDESMKRIWNTEFKAGGKSIKAKDQLPIEKDMQKLLREKYWGVWFHLLESVNNNTMKNIMSVFKEAVMDVLNHENDENNKKIIVSTTGITFHICVLKHRFSLQRHMEIGNGTSKFKSCLDSCMSVDLNVGSSELNEVNELNGWDLHRECKAAHQ